ncbi:MAG: LysM peptidoglycan-binding domain-containing protein [Pseudomonadota bacterium]
MTIKVRLLLLLTTFHALPGFASSADLPLPAELEPDVAFWEAIFTRYDSGEGVLHDNRNLAVIYERLDMPASLSRRERQRRVAERRRALQAVLQRLAGGKREQLDAEEERVLKLWPTDVSNETLRAAAGQIRYQQGLSDRFRRGLERSGRWRAHVEAELEAAGVPRELVALPHVESSYNPAARSHVGASGIWQFTRSTGRRFLTVDHILDERNDPWRATTAAGRLLAYNHSIAGNWPMAITAYNHGLSGVRRAMRQFGDTAYVDILRNYKGRTFGFASRNFYPAFLAASRVDQNRDRYFPGLVFDDPIDYVYLETPGYVAASDLVEAFGVTPGLLAEHNLALQPTVWQGSKLIPKAYRLRLPADEIDGSAEAVLAALDESLIRAEQLPDLFHTVARGDTLSEIAEAYDTRVSTLVALNQLRSGNRIRAGQQLRLPAAGPLPGERAPVAAATATVEAAVEAAVVASLTPPAPDSSAIGEAAPANLEDDTEASAPVAAETALLSDPSDYSVATDATIEVQPLETLGHYADWLGIRTQRLRDLNGLAFRTPVEVGRRLTLDFRTVDRATFEARRIAWQRAQQDNFFRQYLIADVLEHRVKRGESAWILALRRYRVPVWLLRQYNPELDLHNVRPGTSIRFPVLEQVGTAG